MDTLKDVKLVPTGEVLPDGTIQVNESTFNSLVGSTRKLFDLGQLIDTDGKGGDRNSVQQNVTVVNQNANVSTMDVSAAREASREIRRKFADLYGSSIGTEKEQAIITAISEGTSLQVRDSEEPSSSEAD